MSTTTLSAKGVAASSGWRLTAFAGALIESVKRAHAERLATATLQSMDDRMLSDIGVTRGEISRAVRHGVASR